MISFFTKSFTVSLMCFTAVTFVADAKYSRASLRHIEGGGIGYSQGYTTLEGFFAADPQRFNLMPFLDVRGHIFDDGNIAANAGFGFRKLKGCKAYGVNAYYDYRSTKKADYSQAGLGFELLGRRWDFRINGYLPLGRKNSAPYNAEFNGFSGHYLLLSQRYQFAMRGVDAELGYRFGQSRFFDFYAAVGPYCYRGKIGPTAWGGKARLAGKFNEYVSLELSNSYDTMFHNNFQCQLTFNLPFGGKQSACCASNPFVSRIVQPVAREEIIVVGNKRKNTPAINPLTGEPYYFVFVDNTSSSDGTYESPYHNFAQAQDNSSPNDIIYVFPGDGTTTGMDSGILLKANQKFWGSGVDHLIQTSQGAISIPPQSTSAPTITNTNVDTEGNVITLAANNAISGFTITSALNDAIYGTNSESLDVSFCTIKNVNTFAIETSSVGNASVSVTNNHFLENVNGIFCAFNGTSSFNCSNNTFEGQTSVSNTPIEILANNNVLAARIENNTFNNNTTGTIRFAFNDVINADISVLKNAITNNGTGSQSSLASSFVVISTGTNENCSIALNGNSFSGNASNSLYMHTSGAFTKLGITASTNIMSGNGGSGLVLATPADNLTLVVTENLITGCNDNGIAIISPSPSSVGTITITNNTITDVGNASNGIAINQDFSTLNLTISDNKIDGCEGTGIISYAPNTIDSFTLNVSGNTINNCQNLSSNAASGLDIEQFNNLAGTLTDNLLLNNTSPGVFIGSAQSSPSACLEMTGNNSDTGYTLSSGTGTFNLAPCTVETDNIGTITTIGTITIVESCPGGAPCPP